MIINTIDALTKDQQSAFEAVMKWLEEPHRQYLTLGGYAGGIKKKTQLLKKEGVKAVNGRIHNIEDKKFIFK